MNFWVKERLIWRISGSKRRSFSTQEIDRKIIIPQFLRNLHDVLWNEKVILQSSKKTNKQKKHKKSDRIFSLEWNIAYWLLTGPCFELYGDGKHGLFEPKRWWKYDIYWLLESSWLKIFWNGKYSLS